MRTPNVTSSTDSQMHNNIMAAGSWDRPPMLTTGRYPQCHSRFLRYIDIRPNGEALRKYILSGPYKPTTVLVQAIEATDESPAIPEHTTVETPMNMSSENKAHFQAKKEAIHRILTGIGDEIYSTVDACQTALEMWEAIERLQQGESLNIQDVKTNLFLEFGKFTSHDGETMESYYTRFYKMMNEMIRNNLTVTTMQVNVQFLQQLQPEWSRARENVGSPVVQQCGIQCFNCKEFGHFAKKCKKPKRVKDSAYHKEKMLLCKQAEQGVPLQAEQYDWLADRDEELMNRNWKHITATWQGFRSNTCLVETDDSNVIPDSPDMCEDDIQNDQNDVESDDKQLKECKTILAETSKSLGESISVRDSCLVALQTKQTEFEKYKAFNDRKRKLNETLGQLALKDIEIEGGLKTKDCEISVVKQKHDELMKQSLLTMSHYEGLVKLENKDMFGALAIKTHNDSFRFVHELKQEMHADLKYVESLEKEIDKLESDKVEFTNMYDVILQECVSKDVMCSYLMSLSDLDALDELQCLYLHKVKECDCLAQKLSKQTEYVNKKVHTELLQCFAKVDKHLISLEIALQKHKEQNIAISELKKLIEKGKGKSMDTKFDRPFVVRQPNAQRIPKPSVLGKPAPFSNSLERIYFPKTMSVAKANVSEGLSKLVIAQTLPQTARQAVSNTNMLKPGMYRIDNRTTHTRAPQLPQTVRNTNLRVSTSTGVNHKTNVSRPQHKSKQSRDKVLPNNSQVKVKKTDNLIISITNRS
nr:hypothetical protein [Tanacetum cinerariifolium]